MLPELRTARARLGIVHAVERWRRVDPRHVDVLAELERLEPLFHRLGAHATAHDVDAMMAPDFWEIGASGNRYDRAFVLRSVVERLGREEPVPLRCSELAVRELAPDLFLVTYALEQGARRSLRSTIWRRAPQGWQAVFHQGTLRPLEA